MLVDAENFLSSKIKIRHLLPVKTQKWNIQNSIVFWLGPRDKITKNLHFLKIIKKKYCMEEGKKVLIVLIYYWIIDKCVFRWCVYWITVDQIDKLFFSQQPFPDRWRLFTKFLLLFRLNTLKKINLRYKKLD